ncbi:hypothetical protein HCJ66_12100 [Listeria sp. FSL L7-1582]|uniref:hypothetical protein n=1 Tax=Listeria portnoyi TaxID=2713504 RepID=UPI00164DB3E0|nr:hypothetical protein [Listeria portnoyi]MBC6310281.1 hypothetical protein [Listeria portnoyi]
MKKILVFMISLVFLISMFPSGTMADQMGKEASISEPRQLLQNTVWGNAGLAEVQAYNNGQSVEYRVKLNKKQFINFRGYIDFYTIKSNGTQGTMLSNGLLVGKIDFDGSFSGTFPIPNLKVKAGTAVMAKFTGIGLGSSGREIFKVSSGCVSKFRYKKSSSYGGN